MSKGTGYQRAQMLLNSASVAIWEFGPGITRSVDFSKEAGDPDFYMKSLLLISIN